MSYISDITNPLIKVLSHFATLPPHQFAGHAANLEFWTSEVEHCRDVILAYGERFRRMRDAEQAHGAIYGYSATVGEQWGEQVSLPVTSAPRARASTPDSERQALLRELNSAFDSFYRRVKQHQLSSPPLAEQDHSSEPGPSIPPSLGTQSGPGH